MQLVDPLGDPVEFRLVPRAGELPPPEQVVVGRVVDAAGEPVLGAIVSPFGFRVGESRQFGGLDGVDPLTITDEVGWFTFQGDLVVDEYYAKVSARGLAPRTVELLTGEVENELVLDAGAQVVGRLVKDGEPVAGVSIGLVQVDRSGERFTQEFTIGTDADGNFLIPAVTPDDAYFLYGKMATLRDVGALACRRVEVGASGTTYEVGTIEVEEGHRLSGRLVFPEGFEPPADLRVLVGREDAWDTQVVDVAADGSFSAHGLPAERYDVVVRGRGFLASKANYSSDPWNPGSLVGRIDADLTGLRILVEPGQMTLERPSREVTEAFWKRRDEPLRGVNE